MKTKNLLVVLLIPILLTAFMSTPTWAGNLQRNRWEGFAIGVGAAILGNALLKSFRHSDPAPPYTRHDRPIDYAPHPVKHRGHWVVRKVWVPPKFEEAWNPEHYNRHGQWFPGQWITIKRATGYWIQKRIWVSRP